MLTEDMVAKIWTDDIFQPSSTALDDLAQIVQTVDFGILVLGEDDKVISRGTKSRAPRDNVVFELGMFIGALGKARTLVIKPKSKPIKIPSDLAGFNSINYEFGKNSEIKIAPLCKAIQKVIQKYGAK